MSSFFFWSQYSLQRSNPYTLEGSLVTDFPSWSDYPYHENCHYVLVFAVQGCLTLLYKINY